MARKSSRAQSVVEGLVEQRRQYQDWLARLDAEAAGAAPSHVAARVRGDYAARLEAVTAELGQHEGAIRQALIEATSRAEELTKERGARNDELSEARLRRQVGEFDEARYDEVAGRCKSALGELAREIGAAERDIERYEEILALIKGGGAASSQAAPPGGPALAPVPATPAEAAPPPPEADALKTAAAQIDALDELAFLRSVTAGAEPPKAAAPAPAPSAPEPPKIAAPPPPAAPPRRAPPPAAPPSRSGKQRRPSEDIRDADRGTKSLKCGECGTLNFPTEWYCEKCGAELSAF